MSSAGASYAAGKGKAPSEGGAATGGVPGGKAGAAKAGYPGGSKGPKPGAPVAETPQDDRGRSSTDPGGPADARYRATAVTNPAAGPWPGAARGRMTLADHR